MHCRIPFAPVFSLCLLGAILLFTCCDEAAVHDDEYLNLDDDDSAGETYPYALVIGGGLSETLSVLQVRAQGDYELINDARVTGSGINQATLQQGDLYALCSLSHSIVVYGASDLDVDREISVGVGSNPMSMDFDAHGLAWIANFVSEDVSIFDLAPGIAADEREVERIVIDEFEDLPFDPSDEKSPRPNGVAVRGDSAYVTLGVLNGSFTAGGPGVLLKLGVQSREIESAIELNGRDTTGLFEDTESGLIWAVSAGDYDLEEGFVGNGKLEAVDPDTMEIARVIDVDAAPFEMVLDGQGNGWLGNAQHGVLLAVDLESGAQLHEIDLRDPDDPNGLSFVSGLAFTPDGLIWVAEFNHDKLFAINPMQGDIVAEFTVNDGPDTLTVIP